MTARGDIGPTTALTDVMHIVLGVVDTVLMLSILGFGAAALGRHFRIYSLLTVAAVLAGGASTFAFVPRVAAGASTPWLGVLERTYLGAFLLWVAVLAIALLRSPAAPPAPPDTRRPAASRDSDPHSTAAPKDHTEEGTDMHIEYLHDSKYGNGAQVAEEFRTHMAQRGVDVNVHHIRDVDPRQVAPADLYVFSSPGRMGKPRGNMRRFLKKLSVPAGTRYAVLTTEGAPRPDKKTGQLPTEEEIARWQHVRPIMDELLTAHGMVNVAEDCVYVTGMKGPLEDGWQEKVDQFADRIPVGS